MRSVNEYVFALCLGWAVPSAGFIAFQVTDTSAHRAEPTQEEDGRIPRPPVLPADTPLWGDPATLRALLPWACEAVEKACQARFLRRPSARFSSPEAIAEACIREDPLLSPQTAQDRAEGYLGYFEVGLRTVHLSSTGFEPLIADYYRSACSQPRLGLLQLALVHEVTHALDAERYPHLFVFGQGLPCFVVTEGHAQSVTRRVASACGLDAVYEEMIALLLGAPCGGESKAKWRLLEEDWNWSSGVYASGEWFFGKAHELGGHRLVDAVLAQPPKTPLPAGERLAWLTERRRALAR